MHAELHLRGRGGAPRPRGDQPSGAGEARSRGAAGGTPAGGTRAALVNRIWNPTSTVWDSKDCTSADERHTMRLKVGQVGQR